MTVSPQKIAAIKALAEDLRGDPNTREIAKRKLEQYQKEGPGFYGESFADLMRRYPPNPPNPRLAKTPEYVKYTFMDMGQWKKSEAGYTISVEGYRFTLFRKKGWGWRWSKRPVFGTDDPVFCGASFKTISEAREDAWNHLQTL